MLPSLSFHKGAGDTNVGLHACMTSTSPTDPPPHPPTNAFGEGVLDTLIIPALRRLGQDCFKFQASLGYMTPCPKTQAGKVVWLVRVLTIPASGPEFDPSTNPSRVWWCTSLIPVLERQKQVGLWGLLASQLSLIGGVGKRDGSVVKRGFHSCRGPGFGF